MCESESLGEMRGSGCLLESDVPEVSSFSILGIGYS